MKVALRKLTNLIKSEPVLFIALLAVLAQAAQKAIDTGHFTFTAWATYAFQMFMALVARELVVPGIKHTEVKTAVGEAIASLEATHLIKLAEARQLIGVVSIDERNDAVDIAYKNGLAEGKTFGA